MAVPGVRLLQQVQDQRGGARGRTSRDPQRRVLPDLWEVVSQSEKPPESSVQVSPSENRGPD